MKLLPGQCKSVLVETSDYRQGPLLIENDPSIESDLGITVDDAVFTTRDAATKLVVTNLSGLTVKVGKGAKLGRATAVTIVDSSDTPEEVLVGLEREGKESRGPSEEVSQEWRHLPVVQWGTVHQPVDVLGEKQTSGLLSLEPEPVDNQVPELTDFLTEAQASVIITDSCPSEEDQYRRQRVEEVLDVSGVPAQEKEELLELMQQHHTVFSLEDGERGERNLVEMEIDTGDARPCRQRLRRMPFAVRQEVSKQLRSMQSSGVIQLSDSPWSSPVVMVRKKDGTHHFCVDYRELNSLTRQDSFPLPRIDDLLDQLGCSHYFSTLDLASGYWQIRMHPHSIPKTAFTTP